MLQQMILERVSQRETTDKLVKDFGYAKIISGIATGGAMGVGTYNYYI